MTYFTKKRIYITLLASIIAFSFIGCKKDDPEPEPDPDINIETPEDEEEEPKLPVIETPSFTEQIEETKTTINSDSVAWLQIPNTNVDNIVVQSADNNKYLRLDALTKAYSFPGCYFVDYENTIGKREDMSKNTIIYGHNIEFTNNPDGVQFGQLFKFEDIEFAKENPYIYFSSGEEDMVWEIFATFHTNTDFYYIQVNDIIKPADLAAAKASGKTIEPTEIDNETLLGIVDEAKALSIHNYDVEVEEDDKILTLSTCSYSKGKARKDVRFVVMAKLLDPDEVVKTEATVEINPTPKEFK